MSSSFMFEGHITCPAEDSGIMNDVVSTSHRHDPGFRWTYSRIDGDPILGKGVKAYLTTYSSDYKVLLGRLKGMYHALIAEGVKPMRLKIELICYDERFT
jgi:hypothetical protein